MKKPRDVLGTFGAMIGVLAIAATLAGCGGSETGGPKGSGGATQGTGGVTGTGGSGGMTGTGGSGGATQGTGGVTGTGGSGSGGLAAGGSSGSVTGGSVGTGGGLGSGGNASVTGGRSATGGNGGGAGGNGGRTTPVSGTGGGGIDGGAAGRGSGGLATGGRGGIATGGAGGIATGGAGGLGSGGAPGMDGGAPDAPPAKCSDVTTQAECDARSDCHSVFVDPGDCGCAASGCCARFQSCADGDQANCDGPVACRMALPHCEPPYIVSVQGSCYEGCVKQTDCALPPCPQAPPANGAACGPVAVSQTCYYEDCAGAGRTVATCAAGTSVWAVTTGACATIACEATPDSPNGIACPAGKVCVLITSSGPIPPTTTSTCVDHTCGTGPITSECVPSLYGTCTATYSVAGAIFQCQTVSDCGPFICA
jgi:hypothetical protein